MAKYTAKSDGTVPSKRVVYCPICGEKKKSYKNKVWYDPMLSDPKKGKFVYYCTNHKPNSIHFVIRIFKVHNQIVSVRAYIFQDRKPKR